MESEALLRNYFRTGRLRDVREAAGFVIFPLEGLARPGDTLTRFRIGGSISDESEFYTLASLFNFLKGMEAVGELDRANVLTYMTSDSTSSDVISLESTKSSKNVGSFAKRVRAAAEDAQDHHSGFSQGDSSTTNADPFSRLSDELVLQVLSNLPIEDIAMGASRVNRRLEKLCLDASLWSNMKLDLPEICENIDLRKAFRILDRCPLLERLDLSYSPDAALISVYALRYCPRLEELTVQLNQDMEGLLLSIAEHGSSLRKLVNPGVSHGPERSPWNLEILEANIKGLKNLTTIDFSFLDNFTRPAEAARATNSVLRGIADHCFQLEHLMFQDLGGFGQHLTDETMLYFLDKVHDRIKTLDFDGGCLTDIAFVNLKKCQRLESLKIRDVSAMTGTGLNAVCEMSTLKKLKLYHGYSLSDLDFVHAFRSNKMRMLSILFIFGCDELSNEGLIALADNCQALTKLGVEQCDRVSDEGIKHVLLHGKLLELGLYRMDNITEGAFDNIQPTLMRLILEECGIWIPYPRLSEIMAGNPNFTVE